MMAFLLAVVAVIGIGFGSAIALERFQKGADSAFVGSGAKPDPDPKWRDDKPAAAHGGGGASEAKDAKPKG